MQIIHRYHQEIISMDLFLTVRYGCCQVAIIHPFYRWIHVLYYIILVSALLNLFVGSASAKWALIAPVMVPMLMLLGISPEMATGAYRVGDSATNIITPLMVYFPLILIFCQRWQSSFGLGSLVATMLPYSIALMIAGLAMTIGWVILDLPLGPGASVFLD